jgi:phage shock protein E
MHVIWETVLVVLAVLGVVLLIRQRALISARAADRYLQEGALVVDVRSPEEFKLSHVPGALNIPLSALPEGMTSRLPDKNQVLLLHCQAGGRSALAIRLLRANGYQRAFNLGSLSRAERIARANGGTNSLDA